MAWTVRILGMPGGGDWSVRHLPSAPGAQDAAVRRRFPGWDLQRVSARGLTLLYRARPASAAPAGRATGPELSLVTDDGPDAGRLAPVTAEGLTLGRGASRLLLDDAGAPARPTRIGLLASGLEVTGPGEQARRWDGRAELRVGAARVRTARGRQPPLPPPVAPDSPVVDLGSPPAEQSSVLPLTMALGPIVLGVFLAVTTGSAMFLAFGLMSVVGVGVMLGLQRRARTRHAAELAGHAADVAARRAASAPTPADVTLAARSGAADRFGLLAADRTLGPTLRWGTGEGPLPLSRAPGSSRWSAAVRVPQPGLTAPLPGRPTRLTGPDRLVQACARWALFQLLRHAVATGSGLVVEEPGRRDVWWPPAGPGAPLRLTLPAQTWARAARRVWEDAGHLPSPATPASPRAEEAAVVVGTAGRGGPGRVEDVVDLHARTAVCPADGLTVEDLHATGICPATLHWWLQELADDVDRLGLRARTPESAPLTVPAQVGGAVAVRHVRAPLTSAGPETAEEPVVLDLVEDGPHVLIAGTTGSGKSDLLLSVLVGLCVHHPPTELALILLDFKGGASFGRLADLPHTMSVETNHVGAASLRALDAIAAELRRRELLFSQAGVSDYPTFRRRRPDAVLPRLVVAVDELRVLVEEHAEANAVLQRLAATGRSLGFHLLLATQRATGAVSADVRSNLGATIALRTASEQESWDLIGSADAARIDPAAPGTAVLARGGREPVAFRAAAWIAGDEEPVWTRRGTPSLAPPGAAVGPAAEATDWDAVLARVRRVCAAADLPVPPPVVSPALPDRFTSGPASGALALLDDAAHARHVPWPWPAGSAGSAAWIVEPAGGRAEALAAALAVAAGQGGVLVLDGSGEAQQAAQALDPDGTPVTVLSPDESDEQCAARVLTAVDGLATTGGTLMITGWSAWAGLRVKETFRSLEEELHRRLSGHGAAGLRLAAFGSRDLASSRLVLHTPHRFYVPAGTSADHRLVWPRITAVPPVPGRAVLVSPTQPEPGVPAQLAFPAETR